MRDFFETFNARHLDQIADPIFRLPVLSLTMLILLILLAVIVIRLIISVGKSIWDVLADKRSFHSFALRPSQDDYVMLPWSDWEASWLNGAKLQSRETGLLLTYTDERGKRRSARGTVRATQSKDFPSGTIGLPEDVADRLHLKLGDEPLMEKLGIKVAKRFFWENLWNNSDPSIKVSFRTTVWVTVVATVIGLLNSALFEYVICRDCIR